MRKWSGKEIGSVLMPWRLPARDNDDTAHTSVPISSQYDLLGTFNTVRRSEKDPYGAFYVPGEFCYPHLLHLELEAHQN